MRIVPSSTKAEKNYLYSQKYTDDNVPICQMCQLPFAITAQLIGALTSSVHLPIIIYHGGYFIFHGKRES